jgi:hypothetical protein
MPAIIEGPPGPDAAPRPFWRRLGWFVGIAVGASLATALAATALEALLPSH